MGRAILVVGGPFLVAAAIARGRAARLRVLLALALRVAKPVDATRRLERRLHAAAFAAGLALAACLILFASAEAALWVAGAAFVQTGEAISYWFPARRKKTTHSQPLGTRHRCASPLSGRDVTVT